eukprot:1142445-Pelagomonas_calceolata.AAC.2
MRSRPSPQAILMLFPTMPNILLPPSSCSHHVLRSKQRTLLRTNTANHMRQPHQLNANKRLVH